MILYFQMTVCHKNDRRRGGNVELRLIQAVRGLEPSLLCLYQRNLHYSEAIKNASAVQASETDILFPLRGPEGMVRPVRQAEALPRTLRAMPP